MSKLNLYKGFEVELFTGSFNSHIGVSADIEKNFSNFVKEPDNRNVEYITTPEKDYKFLHDKLINPRKKLREFGLFVSLVYPFLFGWLIPLLNNHGFRFWTVFLSLPKLLTSIFIPNKLLYFYH